MSVFGNKNDLDEKIITPWECWMYKNCIENIYNKLAGIL